MSDLADIERRQKEIAEMAKRLVDEKDVPEIQRIGKEIAAKARELQKAALALAAAVTPDAGRNQGGETRVVLTKDQRQRIAEQTGVALDTLVIAEDAAGWARRMPGTEKRIIEQRALAQAARSIVSEEKEKRIKKMIKELEAIPDPTPEVQGVINQLREDPDNIEKFAKELGKRMKENADPAQGGG